MDVNVGQRQSGEGLDFQFFFRSIGEVMKIGSRYKALATSWLRRYFSVSGGEHLEHGGELW